MVCLSRIPVDSCPRRLITEVTQPGGIEVFTILMYLTSVAFQCEMPPLRVHKFYIAHGLKRAAWGFISIPISVFHRTLLIAAVLTMSAHNIGYYAGFFPGSKLRGHYTCSLANEVYL
jgi:hypothetical protein